MAALVMDESNPLTIDECDFHLRVIRGLLSDDHDELSLVVLHERANRVLERRQLLKERGDQERFDAGVNTGPR